MPPQASWRPGSLGFLAVLLFASVVVAVPGCWLAFRNAHLEEQGIDIVQHAYLLRCVATPGEWNEANLGEMLPYPQGSYYPAVALLPLFDNNPLLALRTTAWIAVLWMLAAQYTLLARVFRPWPALALLLSWQAFCLLGKMANINHVFETQFNYSRVVGGASFWLMLVLLTTADTTRWQRYLWQALAIAAASYALLCHLAPGAIAFATLGVFGALEWWRGRRDTIVLLSITTIAGLGLLLTGNRLGMLNYTSHPGEMKTGPLWLMLLWVPVSLVAVVRAYRCDKPLSVEQVVTAALVPSGLFQAYAAWKLWRDASCAAYSVNVLYFYTFTTATFLGLVWVGRAWQQREAAWAMRYPVAALRLRTYGLGVLIAALVGVLGYDYVHRERGLRNRITLRAPDGRARERITLHRQTRPFAVTPQLAALDAELHGHYVYHDPQQPQGAYYATMIGLGVPLPVAQRAYVRAKDAPTIDALLLDPGLAGVLLPQWVEPGAVFATPVDVSAVGPFWCCRARR